MLNVNGFDEILEILLQTIANERCGHASYVGNQDKISVLMGVVNITTDAEPDLINFNNNEECDYVFELDLVDNYFTYSIWPAADENGKYFPNYGLCLVDKDVSKRFEKDYEEFAEHDSDYIKPIRISIDMDIDKNHECNNCKSNNCPNKQKKIQKEAPSVASTVRIDTNDDGTLSGFTKRWQDNNSFFSYTYHSANEKDVLKAMDKFGISK